MTKKELRHHERMEKRRKYIYRRVTSSQHLLHFYFSISIIYCFIHFYVYVYICIYISVHIATI